MRIMKPMRLAHPGHGASRLIRLRSPGRPVPDGEGAAGSRCGLARPDGGVLEWSTR